MLVYQSVYVHKSKSFRQGLTFMPSGSDSRQGAIFGSGTTVDCGNGTFHEMEKGVSENHVKSEWLRYIHEGHRNCEKHQPKTSKGWCFSWETVRFQWFQHQFFMFFQLMLEVSFPCCLGLGQELSNLLPFFSHEMSGLNVWRKNDPHIRDPYGFWNNPHIPSVKLTASLPLKIGRNPIGKDRIPTIHF